MKAYHVESTRQGFIRVREACRNRSAVYDRNGKRLYGALTLSRRELARLIIRAGN